MIRLRRIVSKLRGVFRNARVEEELAREIAAHLALLEDDFRNRGMSPEDARVAARRACGGVERTKQLHRNERSIQWLEHARQNIRYAIRQLRKSPGFTLVAVSTLAVGIGAVTSVFSVVNAVLLQPFAFLDPGRLVGLREVQDEIRGRATAIPDNYRHYLRLKENAKTIEGAAIFSQAGQSISATGEHPRIVGTIAASPDLFRVLGVHPILGRDFADSDAVKGALQVIVLSYEGWQTVFNGNPHVIGETLRLGGYPSTVIGVLPQGLRFPQIALLLPIDSRLTCWQRSQRLRCYWRLWVSTGCWLIRSRCAGRSLEFALPWDRGSGH